MPKPTTKPTAKVTFPMTEQLLLLKASAMKERVPEATKEPPTVIVPAPTVLPNGNLFSSETLFL